MTPPARRNAVVDGDDRPGMLVRLTLVSSAAVFLAAAVANLGLRLTIGGTQLGFPVAIWQAGIGETIIGLSLLSAAAVARRSWAWVAEALAAGGIAFGLLSQRVQGPARDIHLLLVPLVLLGFLLLARDQRRGSGRDAKGVAEAREPLDGRGRPLGTGSDDRSSRAVIALLAVAAVSFFVASGIHAGVTVPLGSTTIRDPFPGAVVPEGLIAVVLAAAAVAVAERWSSRWIAAVAATAFGLVLTAFGLTITLAARRPGDIVYHVTILVELGVTAVTLAVPRVRRSLTDERVDASRAGNGRSVQN